MGYFLSPRYCPQLGNNLLWGICNSAGYLAPTGVLPSWYSYCTLVGYLGALRPLTAKLM